MNDSFAGDGAAKNVKVGAFKISETEVTQGLFADVMGYNPSKFVAAADESQEKMPVERVSFYEALVFCNKLSIQEDYAPVYEIKGSKNPDDWGSIPKESSADWNDVAEDQTADGFRLPHDTEWVYAALGDNAETFTGYDATYFSGCITDENLSEYAWYKARLDDEGNNLNGGNSEGKTHEVGKKSSNSYGLYDMSGNVWEWCFEATSDGSSRVRRGGAWECEWTDQLSVSTRWDAPVTADWDSIGFRIVKQNPSSAEEGGDVNGGEPGNGGGGDESDPDPDGRVPGEDRRHRERPHRHGRRHLCQSRAGDRGLRRTVPGRRGPDASEERAHHTGSVFPDDRDLCRNYI